MRLESFLVVLQRDLVISLELSLQFYILTLRVFDSYIARILKRVSVRSVPHSPLLAVLLNLHHLVINIIRATHIVVIVVTI